MGHWHPSLNSLPVETLDQIVQLLLEETDSRRVGGEDAGVVAYVPNFREGFFTSVASLSRVNKRLRAICKPHLLSYICCKRLGDFLKLTWGYGSGGDKDEDDDEDVKDEEQKAPMPYVRTFSAILPCYQIKVEEGKICFLHALSKEFYDLETSRCATRIPKAFPSLHCLRLHHIPNLDGFFEACGSLACLRMLDISICDPFSPDERYEAAGEDERRRLCDSIMKNVPPLEVLKIQLAFSGSDGHFHASNREKVVKQMNALIRASSSSLLEFTFNGHDNLHVGFDGLEIEQVHCTRLQRLSILAVNFRVDGIRRFVLAHQPHLEELNLDYSCAYRNATLSCLSRIMRGVCPREGNNYAINEDEEEIEASEHPEDLDWGYFECDRFSYGRRGCNVVEMTLSFPSTDTAGNETSNELLTVHALSAFLKQFPHLEVLTLSASRHDEIDVANFMKKLGFVCQHSLPKLRTLHVFFELEEICWGLGDFIDDEIFLPGDEAHLENEFDSDDDDDESGEWRPRKSIREDYEPKWKEMEDKYYFMFESIMTGFFDHAPSAREVFFYFREPREGARSSCWLWRRIPQKGTKIKATNTDESRWIRGDGLKVAANSQLKGFVVGDMMIQGTCRQPPIFTYTVGREASYKKAFSHEMDRFRR